MMKHAREDSPPADTRRVFLAQVATTTCAAALPGTAHAHEVASGPDAPWYRRTLRWGQTNITEIDPPRYDIAWWRRYWKQTHTQGVIVNAGGIVAYYPSRFALHHRAQELGDRDLFGDLTRAAHDDGLVVLARMDSSKAPEPLFQAHPDWFTRDAQGSPHRSGGLSITCINSPYYNEYLPAILREIIERSHPEGFTDNSWSGLDIDHICYCDNCKRRFRERTQLELPAQHDWDDPAFVQWVDWNYARRLEVWDLFNQVTKAAGGPDCLWVGMNSGSVTGQARSFRDLKAICERAEIIMLDHQARGADGFEQNAEVGKLLHGVLGWEKLIPESMPMYQMGKPTFRLASKPAPEARMWMFAGFAGGIQPWWHHISAYHEDRRMYHTAPPVMSWHAENQKYLIDRRPIATVGLVWSQRNTDFFGRDDPGERVEQPWRGWAQALDRAHIPFLPIHADHIESQGEKLAVLVLPNLGALSDEQVAAVRHFVEKGGSLIASGDSGGYEGHGAPRSKYAFDDLLGIQRGRPERLAGLARRLDETVHTYLRLTPERRGLVDGPMTGTEPANREARHPVLAGFDETDILPYGGTLAPLAVIPGAQALLTFVPAFPMYPPETAWMRTPRTDVPGLVVNEPGRARTAHLAADIDRRFAIDGLPDHGDLLANIVRWAARDRVPSRLKGPGHIQCELYEQPGRVVVHLLNLTGATSTRGPVAENVPVGPVTIDLRWPHDSCPRTVSLLVAKTRADVRSFLEGWVSLDVPKIGDHEVLVVET